PELRKAVCRKLKRENGLDYDPAEIVVSAGAKHSLFNVVLTLVSDGDEVLIPAPYWVSYPEQVLFAGGVPVPVETKPGDGFRLTAGAVEKAITPKTKAIIINSPSNPTGAVYDAKTLEAVAKIVVQHDLWVISDEIYEHLIYGGKKHVSIFSVADLKQRGVLVNGLSKAYAMTGWRVGYTAAPVEVTNAMKNLQSQSVSNITTFVMSAAAVALDGDQADVEKMRLAFEKRRDLIIRRVKAIPQLDCTEPEGAFYLMVDVTKLIGKTVGGRKIESGTDFCLAMLDAIKVAAIPGEPFGAPGWVRFSYACSEDTINKGFDRIAKLLKDV
ncbi:MAG TPA: pyridoxal phosphate-dependent aminotransferase, partial [Planctomycetota bacterium]|nr:pyridoxal phosphate-dependent aminotransferase [Planctomycetota bacterium]